MIKSLILKIYIGVMKMKRNFYHWKNMRTMLNTLEPEKSVPSLPIGKYLILIPHSDDEWIGNSTLITDRRYEVILLDMDMIGCDDKNLHDVRFSEMKSIADKYGRKLYSYKEGTCLQEIIKQNEPDFVTVPYFYDWHPEHQQVMHSLYDIKNVPEFLKVIMYQVTVPIASFNITHANVLGEKKWKKKWQQFHSTYKTQINFPAYRLSCQERINGRLLGCYACEVFSVMEYKKWKASMNGCLPKDHEIDEMKKQLNSISAIRLINQKPLQVSTVEV